MYILQIFYHIYPIAYSHQTIIHIYIYIYIYIFIYIYIYIYHHHDHPTIQGPKVFPARSPSGGAAASLRDAGSGARTTRGHGCRSAPCGGTPRSNAMPWESVLWYGIIHDIWYMIHDIWYTIYGIWNMVYDIWYMLH